MTFGRVREIWRYPVKSMAGERLDCCDVGNLGLWGDRGWAIRDDATGEIHNAKRHPVLMQCAAVYCAPPRNGVIPHVEITLPDGARVASDSPDASRRLSELLHRRISLERQRPAADRSFYRRRDGGSRVAGRLARHRLGRRLLQWVMSRGRMARELRESFGREPGEPLPDLTGIPGTAFEFYTPPGTFFDLYPIHVLTSSTLQRLASLNPTAVWDVRRFRPNVFIDTGSRSGAVEEEWVGHAVSIGDVVLMGEMLTIRCAMPMHAQANLPRDPSVLRTVVRESNQCVGLYASVAGAGRVHLNDGVRLLDQ